MKELLIAAVLATFTIGPMAFAEDREKREDDEIVVVGTRSMPSSVGLGVYTVSPPHEFEAPPAACAGALAGAAAIAAQQCARIPPGPAFTACVAGVAAAAASTATASCN